MTGLSQEGAESPPAPVPAQVPADPAPAAAAPAAAAPAAAVPAPAVPAAAPVANESNVHMGPSHEIDYVDKFRNAEKLEKIELVPGTTFTPQLYKLYNLLDPNQQGKVLLKRSIRVNLRFKALKYRSLREELGKELAREELKVRKQVNRILYLSQGDPGDVKKAFKSDERSKVLRGGDRLSIFNQFSDRLIELRKEIMTYKTIEDEAITILNSGIDTDFDASGVDASIEQRRLKLQEALVQLTCFNNQPRILEVVADVILAFLKNPYFMQDRFMNFLLAGAAGTGKTSIVNRISKVFVAAGMFVYDSVLEGDRGSFVAGYLGQTAERTLDFCKSGLDKGVIFVDEAYSLTTWSDGSLDTYSQEAVNTVVDFMTKFKGLYCFMVAGYEKEMRRYFIPSNPGLERRFPYTFVLEEYDEKQMVYIFKYHIMELMGWETSGCGEEAVAPVNQLFNWGGWFFLQTFVQYALEGTAKVSSKKIFDPLVNKSFYEDLFEPREPVMYELVKNYAGSMTNIAEEAVTYMSREIPPDMVTIDSLRDESSSDIEAVRQSAVTVRVMDRDRGWEDMREILERRLINSSLGDAAIHMPRFKVFCNVVNQRMENLQERSITKFGILREQGAVIDDETTLYARAFNITMEAVRPKPRKNRGEGELNDPDEKLTIQEDEKEADLAVATGSGGTGTAGAPRKSTKSAAPSRSQEAAEQEIVKEHRELIARFKGGSKNKLQRKPVEEEIAAANRAFYKQDTKFWPTADNNALEKEFLDILTAMYNVSDHESKSAKEGVGAKSTNSGTPPMALREIPGDLNPAEVFYAKYADGNSVTLNIYTFELPKRHLEVTVQFSWRTKTPRNTRGKKVLSTEERGAVFDSKNKTVYSDQYAGVYVRALPITYEASDDGAASMAFPEQALVDNDGQTPDSGEIATNNGQGYLQSYREYINVLAYHFLDALTELRTFLRFEPQKLRTQEFLPKYIYPGDKKSAEPETESVDEDFDEDFDNAGEDSESMAEAAAEGDAGPSGADSGGPTTRTEQFKEDLAKITPAAKTSGLRRSGRGGSSKPLTGEINKKDKK